MKEGIQENFTREGKRENPRAVNAFTVDEAASTKWQESKRGARHVQLLQPANAKDRRADAADMHSSSMTRRLSLLSTSFCHSAVLPL